MCFHGRFDSISSSGVHIVLVGLALWNQPILFESFGVASNLNVHPFDVGLHLLLIFTIKVIRVKHLNLVRP